MSFQQTVLWDGKNVASMDPRLKQAILNGSVADKGGQTLAAIKNYDAMTAAGYEQAQTPAQIPAGASSFVQYNPGTPGKQQLGRDGSATGMVKGATPASVTNWFKKPEAPTPAPPPPPPAVAPVASSSSGGVGETESGPLTFFGGKEEAGGDSDSSSSGSLNNYLASSGDYEKWVARQGSQSSENQDRDSSDMGWDRYFKDPGRPLPTHAKSSDSDSGKKSTLARMAGNGDFLDGLNGLASYSSRAFT